MEETDTLLIDRNGLVVELLTAKESLVNRATHEVARRENLLACAKSELTEAQNAFALAEKQLELAKQMLDLVRGITE